MTRTEKIPCSDFMLNILFSGWFFGISGKKLQNFTLHPLQICFFYDEFHFSMNSTIDAYNIMFMPQSENNQISNPFQAVSVPYPQTIRMCPVIAAHHKMRQEKHRAGINGKEPSWI